MNWAYLRVEALLPLALGLGATLAACALFALRLHREGGSSPAARRRFLRFTALVFPLAFTVACLWDARYTLRGLWGVLRGRPADQYALGLLRQGGQGFLAPDAARAAAWFRKAAEQGHPEAQLALARACLWGRGVPRDPREALRWALAAADGGSLDGQLLAGDLLRGPDPARADALYARALARVQARVGQGDAGAALTLGFMHLRGQGVPRDLVEGYAWMLEAVRRGLPPAQKVAVVLESGALSPAQRTEAARRAKALAGTRP